ncbi:MAG: heme lyase CcmF/NrfE family subunit [Zoogloeaceae bacterium]|jgi:cytochrome c-type biogenesis protein CcmF|nr:heme lyase CcmF/NrfE family subunit [Zoogloeaceae bacterium]
MLTEIGHFSLILAFPVALFTGVFSLWGAQTGRLAWTSCAKSGALALFFTVGFAYLCLTLAFVNNDFSVRYVAWHSNSLLPLVYRIAGVWGGHEGSLLLWLLMLCGWTLAARIFSRSLPDALRARILGVLCLIAAGFLLFILLTSNPFLRLFPGAAEGRDLNPMLQDPGLVVHPPLLYMGYVGFSVAYAFAIAALLAGRLDAAWARWSRPWTLAAWIFLTLGIACGSWWAYYELGWGGWWFWDPVENASFMPWLIGVALLHSLAATEKRGCFKNWTAFLAILAFSLSLLGTFLVRSGVLTSVHAFASDPARGVFILIFLAVVLGLSLLLFVWRAPSVGLGGRFALFSRESFLLANNVLLAAAGGTVLLGTLYPLIVDAWNAGKISVGPPYFEAVFVPMMWPLLFLLGVIPFVRWKETLWKNTASDLRLPFVAALAAAAALPFCYGAWNFPSALGFFFAVWIFIGAKYQFLRQASAARGKESLLRSCFRQPLSFWGMHLAHVGVAVFVAGVAVVSVFSEEKDVRMAAGDTVEISGYTFRFLGMREMPGVNYSAWQGEMELSRQGRFLRRLFPEKRFYYSSAMPMTEAAIDSGFFRDVYVSLGEPLDRARPDGEWVARVYYKPLVNWIWGGCFLMALGGILAMLDRRYRRSRFSSSLRRESGSC